MKENQQFHILSEALGTSLLLSHLFSKTHRTAAVLIPPAYLLNSPPSTGNQRV